MIGAFELKVSALDESKPCVGVWSSKRDGDLDGVDRDERLSSRDTAVLEWFCWDSLSARGISRGKRSMPVRYKMNGHGNCDI